jgi:hypothetical protein
MPSDLPPIEPPGEDMPDLPESLGWLVGAFTWVRDVVLACSEALGRLRCRHRAYGA